MKCIIEELKDFELLKETDQEDLHIRSPRKKRRNINEQIDRNHLAY